jgi:photosystem II stability/assembly factor-like uncharacterized protein
MKAVFFVAGAVLCMAVHAAEPVVDARPRWEPLSAGLADLDLHSIAVDPSDPRLLYAGGTGARVFRSVDAGQSWQPAVVLEEPWDFHFSRNNRPIPISSVVTHLVPDPRERGVAYAGTAPEQGCIFFQQRIFRTRDAGGGWTTLYGSDLGCDPVRWLAVAPSNPSVLYLADFETSFGDTYAPLMRSDDAGGQWTRLEYFAANRVAIDPLDDRIVYAGTLDFVWYTHLPTGVLKSVDGGERWEPTGLTGTGITALTVDSRDRDTLYAAAGRPSEPWRRGEFRALMKSVDSGRTWAAADGGLEELAGSSGIVTLLLVDPRDSRRLYAVLEGAGIACSLDGGGRWAPLNDGLPTLHVRSIALAAGEDAILYAATPAGVFRLDVRARGDIVPER